MLLSRNQWTLSDMRKSLFLISQLLSGWCSNTCRRSLHDRHSHKHSGGGVGRESLSFFRSIYGAHSSILSINTRKPCGHTHTKAAGEKIRENLGFLPSHICVISTRSPSCKVRPWGIDAPFNWLIAVETRNGKEHTFKNFSFIKQVQEFFFSLRGMTPFVIVVPPTGSTLSLPPSASSWMEGLLHEYETWPTAGSSLLYTATNWWGIIKRPKLQLT